MDVEKFTAGMDADEAPGPSLVPGDEVVWEYRVRNTGDVAILNVLVTDDPEGWICETGALDPGEETVCQHSGVVEVGQYSNTATATATAKSLFGTVTVTDEDTSHYLGESGSGGVTAIRIDVKPGSDSNRINASSKGRIPVAVLSSGGPEDSDGCEGVEGSEALGEPDAAAGPNATAGPDASGGSEASTLLVSAFDPSTADRETLLMGMEGIAEAKGAGKGVAPVHAAPAGDLDGDGIPDLILHFKTQELCRAGMLDMDGTVWVLSGMTMDGEPFSGSDVIHLVGGKSCS